jgi:CHAT domain-containing protein
VTEDPLLRSAVVLAGADRLGEDPPGDASLDDGWLLAGEIAELDLRGTELVVLSACESGVGDLRTGEGVQGLRRAFLYAGARTLVTSLFQVPDKETRELMGQFHRGLKSGQGKLASLHEAQLTMIRERRKNGAAAHPFFWAGFVLVGDPD